MLIRISLGLLSYVFVSMMFRETFSFYSLGLSMFFVLLPLSDWIPYLLIRKRYKLVSHYLWYYPLVYVPIGTLVVYLILGDGYYTVLFIVNSLANFIHATFRTPSGLQWLWPFSKMSASLHENKLKIFSKEEREEYLEKVYKEYEMRSLSKEKKDEMRTVAEEFSDRRHPKGRKTIALLIISVLLVLIFWFLD